MSRERDDPLAELVFDFVIPGIHAAEPVRLLAPLGHREIVFGLGLPAFDS